MKKLNKIFIYLILILGAFVSILPFLWMISTSLKPFNEIFAMPPKWIPSKLMWSNYIEVNNKMPIGRYFVNSLFVTISITLGTLVTSVLAAFAFSRIKFWGRDVIFSIFLGTMMIPGEVLIIPNYITLSKLGWINSYKALIIPWTVSVFSIFLLRQFFLGIPEVLYYAAKMDGCSDLKFIIYIMVPICKPALITVALIRIIYSWNEFLWPLIVTDTPLMRTLPVGLSVFTSETGSHYNLLMAAATIIIIPIILVYFVLQKYIIAGISKAGIKG